MNLTINLMQEAIERGYYAKELTVNYDEVDDTYEVWTIDKELVAKLKGIESD